MVHIYLYVCVNMFVCPGITAKPLDQKERNLRDCTWHTGDGFKLTHFGVPTPVVVKKWNLFLFFSFIQHKTKKKFHWLESSNTNKTNPTKKSIGSMVKGKNYWVEKH